VRSCSSHSHLHPPCDFPSCRRGRATSRHGRLRIASARSGRCRAVVTRRAGQTRPRHRQTPSPPCKPNPAAAAQEAAGVSEKPRHRRPNRRRRRAQRCAARMACGSCGASATISATFVHPLARPTARGAQPQGRPSCTALTIGFGVLPSTRVEIISSFCHWRLVTPSEHRPQAVPVCAPLSPMDGPSEWGDYIDSAWLKATPRVRWHIRQRR
jgi:hypothetical protein